MQNVKFNKGDSVVVIGSWNNKGAFYARRLTIESWGKEQGTASRVANGKFIKSRIYTNNANKLVNDSGFLFFAPEFYFADGSINVEAEAIKIAAQWRDLVIAQAEANLAKCKDRGDAESRIKHQEEVVAEYKSYVPSFEGYK